MKRALSAMLSACLTMALIGPLAAQKVEWKQVANPLPKGLNMPQGMRAEILGIELGDSFAEAKAKLEKFRLESVQAPEALQERDVTIRFGDVGFPYVPTIIAKRYIKGATARNAHESLQVIFSAPSSGQQVIGIKRDVTYPEIADQPLVSGILASLREKFKAEPIRIADLKYIIVFDNGQPYRPPSDDNTCNAAYGDLSQGGAHLSNRSGRCDVYLRFEYRWGVSDNHAKDFSIILSDNERTKLTKEADMGFLRSYIKDLQSRGGAAPKL